MWVTNFPRKTEAVWLPPLATVQNNKSKYGPVHAQQTGSRDIRFHKLWDPRKFLPHWSSLRGEEESGTVKERGLLIKKALIMLINWPFHSLTTDASWCRQKSGGLEHVSLHLGSGWLFCFQSHDWFFWSEPVPFPHQWMGQSRPGAASLYYWGQKAKNCMSLAPFQQGFLL